MARGEAHGLSDAVAGTLMGASIGWYIGNTFYKTKKGATNVTPKVTIAPLFYDDQKGAVVSVRI